MRFKALLKIILIAVVFVLSILPVTAPVLPARAVGASVQAYMADCSSFSAIVSVTGSKNDGNGIDQVRYEVRDGVDKLLYGETANIPVGTTVNSIAIDLFYQNNVYPARNPIWFSIIDLDASGNNQLYRIPFQVPCLPPSGPGSSVGFQPPNAGSGTMNSTAPLFEWPGQNPIGMSVQAGEGKNVIYRTPDGAWAAVWVGGQELVWVQTSAVNIASIWAVPIPPTALNGSGITGGMNQNNFVPGQLSLLGPGYLNKPIPYTSSANAPATTSGTGGAAAAPAAAPSGTYTTRSNVNVHAGPGTGFGVTDSLPGGTALSLVGRNSTGVWLKVGYNGKQGWVATYYVNVDAATVRGLPVTN